MLTFYRIATRAFRGKVGIRYAGCQSTASAGFTLSLDSTTYDAGGKVLRSIYRQVTFGTDNSTITTDLARCHCRRLQS